MAPIICGLTVAPLARYAGSMIPEENANEDEVRSAEPTRRVSARASRPRDCYSEDLVIANSTRDGTQPKMSTFAYMYRCAAECNDRAPERLPMIPGAQHISRTQITRPDRKITPEVVRCVDR
jgi:hypothetical protein